MTRRELESLVQQMVDGSLDAAEISALENELLENPESREFYRRSMRTEQLLEDAMSVPLPTSSGEWMEGYLKRRHRRAMGRAVLAAAAVLILSAWVLHLIFLQPPDQSMRVEFSPGAVWSGEVGDEGLLEPGSLLRVEFGAVELQLAGGVRGLIEGPAEMHVRDPMMVELREGKAWFSVGGKGHGFRLRTPWTDVVDLGTEFGVATKPNELDEVHVFKGKVQSSARFAMKESLELTAGQAARVSPIGRWIAVPPAESAFMKKLPPRLPGVRFSFDGEDPLVPEGEHPAVESMRVTTVGGGKPNLVEGIRGSALSIRDSKDTVRTDWPGLGGDSPRTIACWIRPGGSNPSKFSTLVSWGAMGRQRPERCQVMLAKSPTGDFRVLRFSLGHRLNFSGSTPITSGAWQHVAVVFRGVGSLTGDMVELYVNGKREPVDSEFSNTPSEDREISTRIEGRFAEPLQIGKGPSSEHGFQLYTGEIDKVWILARALSEREVMGLMNGN
jgi:hypothetical protein